MIIVKEFPNKTFSDKEELFKELKENKASLISLKKAENKKADAYSFVDVSGNDKEISNKAEMESEEPNADLLVKVIINTTNLLDSHCDVHIPGIWKKSLNDNKFFLHLQEHEREFEKIITDTAKGYTKSLDWSKLGYSFDGKTEALIFDSVIKKKRNSFMYDQYLNGWVKNHSVGMRYVQMYLCINSEAEWNAEEKENWDKYYPMVSNKEIADEKGYFWAVTEAKIIEGSAVVIGSNYATPTMSAQEIEEPDESTPYKEEPAEATQTEKRKISII